ncbi:MAG TPA: hypothetical protein PKV66_01845 [Candidatus Pelethenecus sp.]|nr:hypothetical protein [Candidatus Pelethenecus sp.]
MNLIIIDDKSLVEKDYGESKNRKEQYIYTIRMINEILNKHQQDRCTLYIFYEGENEFSFEHDLDNNIFFVEINYDNYLKIEEKDNLYNNLINFLVDQGVIINQSLFAVDAVLTNSKEEKTIKLSLQLSTSIVNNLLDNGYIVNYYSAVKNDEQVATAFQSIKQNDNLYKVPVCYSYPDSVAHNLCNIILKNLDRFD